MNDKESVSAGYSGTPLAKKLGMKVGCIVFADGPPENYRQLLEPIPSGLTFRTRLNSPVDIIHMFSTKRHDLERKLPRYMKQLNPSGAIWVSWPKRASKVPSEITEDIVRAVALPLGLVDVKVCAVDQTWSGLRLVIRKN